VSNAALVRVRICKVPPTERLEGIDLRRYAFREGETYEVGRRLGELLVAWGYAAEEAGRANTDRTADKP
jgi:hypothetical protein